MTPWSICSFLQSILKQAMQSIRSVSTAVYQFRAHLIWAYKLGKPGKNFFMKVNYFFFLAYQKSVKLFFQSASHSFVDRQTKKSKDQALKHLYLGSKSNLGGYHPKIILLEYDLVVTHFTFPIFYIKKNDFTCFVFVQRESVFNLSRIYIASCAT